MAVTEGYTRQFGHPSSVAVSLAALRQNLAVLKAQISSSTKLLAVVKADAYGHGLVPVAEALVQEGVDGFGVIRLEAALALRQSGITKPILLMRGVADQGYEAAVVHDLLVGVIDLGELAVLERVAAARSRRVGVHLKVDTGMHRLGVPALELFKQLHRIERLKHVDIQGLFSQLANADNLRDPFAMTQQQHFTEVCQAVESHLNKRLIKHLANSDGLFRSPQLHMDMVRPGIALYGYAKRAGDQLHPIMQLKSNIVQIKRVAKGESVGYDRHFIAERPTTLAIVPIGYADGFSRAYAGQCVIVRGNKVPVIGRVCMDLLTLDITDVSEAAVGDEVVLLGRSGKQTVSVFDLARAAGTTHYEVLTSISPRLPRLYHQPAEKQ